MASWVLRMAYTFWVRYLSSYPNPGILSTDAPITGKVLGPRTYRTEDLGKVNRGPYLSYLILGYGIGVRT